ncbi:phage holin family protein [Acetobacterium paludosum]|uniref:Phage holin family protein n=1 Tax=Acetobacterium paludosum TaxID=52693 RepID=A0A923KTG7_9FIRM|nr:phage holin family protein [Acetobacterium paludosum]MBC3889402.1 phage holin family protein [Acetobacterium paludosum]
MTKLFMKYLSIIVTIYFLSLVFHTIQIDSISALLIMGLVLLGVNLLLKPILLLVTLPLSLLTLGLFSFIVNAWTIMIADHFVTNISMGGFLNSLIAAFIIVFINQLFMDINKNPAKY